MQSNLLLLVANLGRAFQKHVRKPESSNGMWLIIGLAVVVTAILAALYFLERRRTLKSVRTDSEQLLFRELCRIHGLTNDQSVLLLALVESRGIKRCEVFIDPSILDSALAGNESKMYVLLKEKLFGDAS